MTSKFNHTQFSNHLTLNSTGQSGTGQSGDNFEKRNSLNQTIS